MLEHPTIRILIADDHLLVRDGLKRLIDDQSGMEVVAEAMNGPDALQLAQQLLPGIAIVDVSMPGMDGVALTRLLQECCPEVKVLALTRHDDAAFVRNPQCFRRNRLCRPVRSHHGTGSRSMGGPA
jgi:YesN/AraC family two-component response regulator